MSIVDAIGWLAALSSATLALPQGVRIAVTRSVAGVSVVMWQTTLTAGLAWSGHGLHTALPQIIWPNLLLALTSAGVLAQLTRARRLPVLRTWALPVLAAGLAIAADLAFGPVAFAVLAFAPAALGQANQLREIRRAPDTQGVSMVGLMLNLGNQILWLGFAVPSGETAVICVATPMALLAALSIGALSMRRRTTAGTPVVSVARA